METTPGHDLVGDLDRHDELAGRRADAGMTFGVEPETFRVVGVDLDRAAVLALHQGRQVVHPRVVRAQLAAADQHHAAVAMLGERRLQTGTSATIGSGASSILPDGGAQHLGQPLAHRAHVDPVRIGLELRERQAVGIGAESLAEGADAQEEVDDPLRAAPIAERGRDLLGSRPSIGEPVSRPPGR